MVLVMRRALVIAAIASASSARADTLNVPSADYPTLAAAIDAVSPGDEIIIADGVYRGRGWTDLILNVPDVSICSASGRDACLIDCERSGWFLLVDELSDRSKIKGLTVVSSLGGFLAFEGSDCEVRGCAFVGGAANGDGGGGAIYSNGGDLLIADTVFDSCTARDAGGAIAHYGGDLTMDGCTFIGCEAGWGGGAVWIQGGVSGGTTTITNSSFTANGSGAPGGGAILSTDGATLVIGNTTFDDNQTVGTGSAVAAEDGSDVTITGCSITGGTAVLGGGVWVSGGSTVALTGTICSGNSGLLGAALAIDQSNATATDCEFSNNDAGDGGAWNATNGSSVLNGCDFYDNSATGNGGGCSFNGGSAELNDCNSSGNSAESGGFIHADGTEIEMNGCSSEGDTASATGGACSFVDCPSGELRDGTIVDCGAAVGGGVYNAGGSPVYTNYSFTGCAATAFGGAMTNDGATCTVVSSSFIDNSAVQGGGHIASSSGSTLQSLWNYYFEGEASQGGALFNLGFGSNRLSGEIVGCSFVGNTATDSGGAIYNSSSSPLVSLCSFGGNSAIVGGSIYNLGSSPEVSNGILWGNSPNEITDVGGSTTTVLYSNVQGGWAGAGNTDADPMYADVLGGDLRLLPGSPCIDAGNNTLVPADALDLDEDGDTAEALPLDLDGLARFVDDPGSADTGESGNGYAEIVDMGGYELQIPPCPPDLNGDGDVNTLDFLEFLGLWAASDAGADWNGDGTVNTLDFLAFLNDWVAGC